MAAPCAWCTSYLVRVAVTWIYVQEVWKGFLVALLIAAAFDALVPRAWLLTVLNRRTRLGQAAAPCRGGSRWRWQRWWGWRG